jgi:LmbE family N-acetylglucosaminyl deacetylase
MRILVLAAHPDDEVLGCGGTIARLSQEGNELYIAILGEGITSRYKSRNDVDSELLKELRLQTNDVASYLGAKELFIHDLPDNRFDTIPLLEVIKIIEGLICNLGPQILFTHHCGDLNIDHRIVFTATLTAARPMMNCSVKQIYAYEVPSATDWSMGCIKPVFCPNVFLDISDTLEKKIEAMNLYDKEIRIFPHPRSAESLRALARQRGVISGVMAAEAFELIRNTNPFH